MEGEKIPMWGSRVTLGKADLMQFSNREPWKVLEHTSGFMKLLTGVRYLGVSLLPPLSWPGPAPTLAVLHCTGGVYELPVIGNKGPSQLLRPRPGAPARSPGENPESSRRAQAPVLVLLIQLPHHFPSWGLNFHICQAGAVLRSWGYLSIK